MDVIVEWAGIFLRWAHVLAGILWIGESFYFVALDSSLKKSEGLPPGVSGEAWQVHGGGFYRLQKYMVAPERMPDHLHWFKWESYFTWLTGFFLMTVIYYWSAEAFLIDVDVRNLRPVEAISISLALLAAGWVAYDLMCRSRIGHNTVLLAAAVFAMVVISTWVFGEVFSARAAFLHVGAFVGTIMTGNVFFVIIPNQKKVVADLVAGREPDPALGEEAKQRSMHNNYLTLPVILMMISSHYPQLFGHPHGWAVIAVVLLLGGFIRHYFNTRNAGVQISWQPAYLAASAALAIGLIVLVSWRPGATAAIGAVSDERALAIVEERCSTCHARFPSDEDFEEAPGEVIFAVLADLRRYSEQIIKQTVVSKAMPLANKTRMTPEERAELGAWLAVQ